MSGIPQKRGSAPHLLNVQLSWMIAGAIHGNVGCGCMIKKVKKVRGNQNTGAAWLSSARVVRCWVKSSNERNPCPMFNNRRRLPGFNQEEGGDDVKSAWPLRLGLHTCYNGRYNGSQSGNAELIPSKLAPVRIEVCNSTS